MVLLNKEQIQEIIPHRDPFLLIDEVIALEPGVKCIAQKFMSEDEFWFAGHFPEHPVTPGVLLVEMLAQAGAVCAGTIPENKGKIAFLAKIDNAKFHRQVLPGETVVLEVQMTKMKSRLGVGKATATVNGEKAVSVTLTFVFPK